MKFLYQFRPAILHIAQWCNRNTRFLDGLKKRFHLQDFAARALTPLPSDDEVADIRRSLQTTIIAERAQNLIESGLTPDFYILMTEGIGDIVAVEPVAPYLKRHWPSCKIHWVIRNCYRVLIEGNPSIDEIITFPTLAEGYEFCRHLEQERREAILVNCHMDGASCTQTLKIIRNPNNPRINFASFLALGSLQETFCLAAGLPALDEIPHFYFGSQRQLPAELSQPYIVIHCRSNSVLKDWPKDKWERLVEKITALGVRIVEIGMPHTINFRSSLYYDFSGRRDLRDVAWVIKNALLFIGVDSGFSHIANALQKTSIVMVGRYSHFETYNPFGGAFSRSPDFKILRPPLGEFVHTISYETVARAFDEQYKRVCHLTLQEVAS